MGLSRQFGYHAQGMMDASPAATNAAPQTTLLAAMAPTLNTSLPAMNVNAVDPNKPNAAAAAQQNQATLSGAQDAVQRTQAAAAEVIRGAQAEITAACKVNATPVQQAFPIASMTADSEAELLGSGTMAQVASGALKVADTASMAADVASSMTTKAPEEVMTAIEDTLRAASAPEPAVASFGLIQDANAPAGADRSAFDWNAILDEHPDALAEIMYCDPDNPSASFPELVAMDDALDYIEEQMELQEAVLDNDGPAVPIHSMAIDAMDTPSLTAQAPLLAASGAVGHLNHVQLAAAVVGPGSGAPGMSSDLENALAEMAIKAEMDRAPAAPMSMM